jgi:uncharacterized alkaline shock family protein YloU
MMNDERIGRVNGSATATAAAIEQVEEEGYRGTVAIAPVVLIEMIELTVEGVPGVVGLQSRPRRLHRRPAAEASGGARIKEARSFSRGGITVRVAGNTIDTDVSIRAGAEESVPEIGRRVQERVGVAVERMLGMAAGRVNVRVAQVEAAPRRDQDKKHD